MTKYKDYDKKKAENKPLGETKIRYLNINYRNRWGLLYYVAVSIRKKQFVVWRGNDIEIGKKVAEKVQELMSISRAEFLSWYDYDREEWLLKNGYQNANRKRTGCCMQNLRSHKKTKH